MFSDESFPEVGEKQKAQEKKKKERKKKKKVGENNGQLRFRPPPRVSGLLIKTSFQLGCGNIDMGV